VTGPLILPHLSMPDLVTPLTNSYAGAAIQSPEWWLRRLHEQLVLAQPEFERFNAYYSGDHPLPWLPSQARAEFRRVLQMSRANVCGLVVDATAERIQAEGFRIEGTEEPDPEMWRIWQKNRMDGDSDLAILESLICGRSYTLVEPVEGDDPNIFVEHPSQAIVAYTPGTNRREKAAGLKVWIDEWTGLLAATLYLPEWIYKFETDRPKEDVTPAKIEWRRRLVAGENWPARNPLGEVPLTEVPNNPRLLLGGQSELYDIIDIQDRINKTLADRLITQDFGAFPQKWATGYPDDGEEPVDIGRDRMLTTDVVETKFGQFQTAALEPFSEAKREDVKDMAMRTRTPAQYLLGEMSNVNGETLKAAESGLVSKVRQRARAFAEGFEDTMRLVCKAAGRDVPEAIETIWKNPEFRTDGETTDAAIKRVQAGLADIRQGREDVGYSATQIKNMEERDQAINPLEFQKTMHEAELAAAQAASNSTDSDENASMRGDRQFLNRRRRDDKDGDNDGISNESGLF
jgi:hypothetical protein